MVSVGVVLAESLGSSWENREWPEMDMKGEQAGRGRRHVDKTRAATSVNWYK